MKILKLKRAFGPRWGRRRHWLKLGTCQLGKNSKRCTSSSVGKLKDRAISTGRLSSGCGSASLFFFFCFRDLKQLSGRIGQCAAFTKFSEMSRRRIGG
ncbi:hypothetical protein CGRA01v4_06095 [Colletotrichum graminicola]|nr:hypothetical protein CGRA01v4_06095 [Colletotrichum graminicola]